MVRRWPTFGASPRSGTAPRSDAQLGGYLGLIVLIGLIGGVAMAALAGRDEPSPPTQRS